MLAACGSSGPSAAQQYLQAANKANAALAAAAPGLDGLSDSSTADQVDSAYEPVAEAFRVLDEAVRRIHFEGAAAADAKALLAGDEKVEGDIGSLAASYAANPTAVTQDVTSASGAADQLRADLGLPPAPALASTSAEPTQQATTSPSPSVSPTSGLPSQMPSSAPSTAPAATADESISARDTVEGIDQRAVAAVEAARQALFRDQPDDAGMSSAANALDGVADSIEEYVPGGSVPILTGNAGNDAFDWRTAIVNAESELNEAASGGYVPNLPDLLQRVIDAGNKVASDVGAVPVSAG